MMWLSSFNPKQLEAVRIGSRRIRTFFTSDSSVLSRNGTAGKAVSARNSVVVVATHPYLSSIFFIGMEIGVGILSRFSAVSHPLCVKMHSHPQAIPADCIVIEHA